MSTKDTPSARSISEKEKEEEYEKGYKDGQNSRDADYDAALDETGFTEEVSPTSVSEYIRTLEKEHLHMKSVIRCMAAGHNCYQCLKNHTMAKEVLSSLTIHD